MQHRILFTAMLALAGCQSPDNLASTPEAPIASAVQPTSAHHGPSHHSDAPLPTEQLARVKLATARYQDFENALKDGYKDINVVIPNMGRHFLKDSLLDGKFEVERPELLVYSPQDHAPPKLVAVEYAVPLSLSEKAPAGFKGEADEWFANEQFQLWTLHAWVWKENPDGVFNPTNRLVP